MSSGCDQEAWYNMCACHREIIDNSYNAACLKCKLVFKQYLFFERKNASSIRCMSYTSHKVTFFRRGGQFQILLSDNQAYLQTFTDISFSTSAITNTVCVLLSCLLHIVLSYVLFDWDLIDWLIDCFVNMSNLFRILCTWSHQKSVSRVI